MARKVIWTAHAARALEGIVEYIAGDSEVYARALAVEIVKAGRSLDMLARRGRVVPEYGGDDISYIK